MFKRIETEEAPFAIGPYSQAVQFKNILFVSGQIPVDPKTNQVVKGDISIQTERVIKNIEGILKAAGAGIENVVKTTVFLKNIKDFEKMNFVYASFFRNKPARSTVEVSSLPKGVLIEIECIAILNNE